MEIITQAQLHLRMMTQGVSNVRHCAFVCPVCGTVQSMASLVHIGKIPMEEAETKIGFSCIGRLTGAGPFTEGREKGDGKGCDWTLGGLFRVHKLEVLMDDGQKCPLFELASPSDAMKLEVEMLEKEDEQQTR